MTNSAIIIILNPARAIVATGTRWSRKLVERLRRRGLAGDVEFIVVICGDITTMPGLPTVAPADTIDVNAQGRIVGLS